MTDGLKASLERLERLVHLRQTYVSVAEAGVKQAEGEMRRLESANNELTGNIRATQAGIAHLQSSTGQAVQISERYMRALEYQRKLIQQSLVKATTNLDLRRSEWTEAMREEKIVAKLQEHRVHQSVREDDAVQQKSQDDASISRYVRTRLEK